MNKSSQLYDNIHIDFSLITNVIIDMINNNYFDLQMYGNFVFSIDNDAKELTDKNNLSVQISTIRTENSFKYRLFTLKSMKKLLHMVTTLSLAWTPIFVSVNDYMGCVDNPCILIDNISFFKNGSTSPAILLQANKLVKIQSVNESPTPSAKIIPIILKLVPCCWHHHYEYFDSTKKNKEYIQTFVESPLCAIFFKEAWLIHFAKTYLKKYIDVFSSVANCYIFNGLPITSVDQIKKSYHDYTKKNPFTHKKWFDITINNESDIFLTTNFMCIEMKRLDNTLLDDIHTMKAILKKIARLDRSSTGVIMTDTLIQKLTDKKNKLESKSVQFEIINRMLEKQQQLVANLSERNKLINLFNEKRIDLSFIFEYLYGKLVAAFIGRIILTDDHFGNIGYISTNCIRHYEIKCDKIKYHFYMSSTQLVQFIDLERYIFNYTTDDIYTANLLKNNTGHRNIHAINDYIFDKSIHSFINQNEFYPCFMSNESEYDLMQNIFSDKLTYGIKTFCQAMQKYLPAKYLNLLVAPRLQVPPDGMNQTVAPRLQVPPNGMNQTVAPRLQVPPNGMNMYDNSPIKHYYIDLDDDSLCVINHEQVLNNF